MRTELAPIAPGDQSVSVCLQGRPTGSHQADTNSVPSPSRCGRSFHVLRWAGGGMPGEWTYELRQKGSACGKYVRAQQRAVIGSEGTLPAIQTLPSPPSPKVLRRLVTMATATSGEWHH
ncbi:hypothetical protein F7725_021920, partial [Dissostichus mawsoni]